MDRALASKREWWQASSHPRGTEPPQGDLKNPEQRLRYTLTLCVSSLRGEGDDAPWTEALDVAAAAASPIDLTTDEPGVVLCEALAAMAPPSRLLEVVRHLHPATQDLIFEQWSELVDAIPLSTTPPAADFVAAARAYAAYRSAELADCLEHRFIEGGDDPCSRGDLYLTRDDRFFFNYSYLCGEFGLGRDEAIASLRALSQVVKPSEEQLERLGGEASFTALLGELLALDGDAVPHALAELLPLVDLPFTEVTTHLPQRLISRIAVTAVARRLGFTLEQRALLEVYEILTLYRAAEGDRHAALEYLANLYRFEPDAETLAEGAHPSQAWQQHWGHVRELLGEERTTHFVLALIEVYSRFATMLGVDPTYRLTAAWQVATLAHPQAAESIIRMTTEHGETSPIIAASLLHDALPPLALEGLATAWSSRVEQVPQTSSWSRDFTVLVLRHAITRQRAWLLDRLTDLYLRGGGYEAGEDREIIEAILEGLLDEMALDPKDRARLDSSKLHFELLPFDINIFTGETVDASRWASPTSAYKYVRTLLRLEDRGLDYLASLVSERRVVALEKALRKLDFHTSVQQIVACVSAFDGAPENALKLLLLLRTSDGERPSRPWLEQAEALLAALGEKRAAALLWDLYDADNGDAYSLNPGLFWALRLVPGPQSVARLAKAATEMVRRKPSYAIAALDTLDSVGTRGALSAILQMRRRIRNRKVVKLINRTIDRIAEAEGLDREVFLDYAVDTGDLERDSSRLFDFGSHRVTLRLELDGRISTAVLDAKGRHLRSFPKTAKDADPALYKEFQATKKLLVETLSYQVRRLEQAMINGRNWRGKDFLEIFREHPVMAHLGQRLLWARVDSAGRYRTVLLPTAEGFVNSRNRPVRLKEEDNLVILHPLFLDDKERDTWLSLLAELEVEQPFAQLEREVYRPLPSEQETKRTQRLVGLRTDSDELYKVVKERGWSTDGGGPWEVGNATHSYRVYPAAQQSAHLDTDVLGYDKQLSIIDIRFTHGDEEAALEIGDVHPVIYSEAFRDLMLCFEVAPS